VFEDDETFSGLNVCRRDDETDKTFVFKVYNEKFYDEQKKNPNYANVWARYIEIYNNNDQNFTIEDYRLKNNLTNKIMFTDEYSGKVKQLNIPAMITALYKECAVHFFDVVNFFTDFDYTKSKFTKKNAEYYSILNNKEHGVFKKQLATFQALLAKGNLRTFPQIVFHLKNYISVNEFIAILLSFRILMDEEAPFVQYENIDVFGTFLTVFCEQYALADGKVIVKAEKVVKEPVLSPGSYAFAVAHGNSESDSNSETGEGEGVEASA
jgi:hypothetical protein